MKLVFQSITTTVWASRGVFRAAISGLQYTWEPSYFLSSDYWLWYWYLSWFHSRCILREIQCVDVSRPLFDVAKAGFSNNNSATIREALQGDMSAFTSTGCTTGPYSPLQRFAANAQIVSSNTYVGMHSLLMVTMAEEICCHGAISH